MIAFRKRARREEPLPLSGYEHLGTRQEGERLFCGRRCRSCCWVFIAPTELVWFVEDMHTFLFHEIGEQLALRRKTA